MHHNTLALYVLIIQKRAQMWCIHVQLYIHQLVGDLVEIDHAKKDCLGFVRKYFTHVMHSNLLCDHYSYG